MEAFPPVSVSPVGDAGWATASVAIFVGDRGRWRHEIRANGTRGDWQRHRSREESANKPAAAGDVRAALHNQRTVAGTQDSSDFTRVASFKVSAHSIVRPASSQFRTVRTWPFPLKA